MKKIEAMVIDKTNGKGRRGRAARCTPPFRFIKRRKVDIESLEERTREKSEIAPRDSGTERDGRREPARDRREERYLSLLSSRVAETMRSIVECPLVDMRIPYLLSYTARP